MTSRSRRFHRPFPSHVHRARTHRVTGLWSNAHTHTRAFAACGSPFQDGEDDKVLLLLAMGILASSCSVVIVVVASWRLDFATSKLICFTLCFNLDLSLFDYFFHVSYSHSGCPGAGGRYQCWLVCGCVCVRVFLICFCFSIVKRFSFFCTSLCFFLHCSTFRL